MNKAVEIATKAPLNHGFLAAWAIVGAAAIGWVMTLWPVWMSKPDLSDRFLIPSASAGLIYWLWPRLRACPHNPTWWGAIPLAFGVFLFTVGWYIAVQVSGRPIVVWWLTIAFMLMLLGLTLLHFGPRQMRLLLFPVLFMAFSLPTPGRIYNPLMLRLKQFTTTSAEHVLPWLGVSVNRLDPNAFELLLPSGSLGVVEACSGVRSVTALTAIAVLVAYLFGFGIGRGAVLVGLTVGVIALTNAIRVVVTGLLQEYIGLFAIEGWCHEALGIGVVLIGLALIIALAFALSPRGSTIAKTEPEHAIHSEPTVGIGRCVFALGVLIPALAGCLWAVQYRIDHRVVVRLDELPRDMDRWRAKDMPIPAAYTDELMCDQMIFRAYTDDLGKEVVVWVMFWSNAATTAHMHHPDICYPSHGWENVTAPVVSPIALSSGCALPVSARHYVRPNEQQLLFYWTQHGAHVLADGVEKPELFSGHSWIFDLLRRGHQPIDTGARIAVLIGTKTRGSSAAGEKLLREFTEQFAGELYRACPWASPRSVAVE